MENKQILQEEPILSQESLERITSSQAVTGDDRELHTAWLYFSEALTAADASLPQSISTDFRIRRKPRYGIRCVACLTAAVVSACLAIIPLLGSRTTSEPTGLSPSADSDALVAWDEWDAEVEAFQEELSGFSGDTSVLDTELAWMGGSLSDWTVEGDMSDTDFNSF